MRKKYFYIIQRNGLITEKEYDMTTFAAVCQEWKNGGLIFVKLPGQEAPLGINAVDIINILPSGSYPAYLATTRPKRYIVDGVWYDGKTRQEVDVEPWRALERAEAQKKLAPPPDLPPTPEERAKMNARRDEISSWVKGGFKNL